MMEEETKNVAGNEDPVDSAKNDEIAKDCVADNSSHRVSVLPAATIELNASLATDNSTSTHEINSGSTENYEGESEEPPLKKVKLNVHEESGCDLELPSVSPSPVVSVSSSSSLHRKSFSTVVTDEQWKERQEIKTRIKRKQEILDQLQKVEAYRKKWSLEELDQLATRWKQVALNAFEDLFIKSRLEKESLTKKELIEYLGVEAELIGLDLSNPSTQELDEDSD